jgi:hypothetical protein
LLRRVGHKADFALAAFVAELQHRFWVVWRDNDQIGQTLIDISNTVVPCICHRSGVERSDLVVL